MIPLYVLQKQIVQAEKELEELKNDPSTNHDEISELDAILNKHKLEFSKRVNRLNLKGNGGK